MFHPPVPWHNSSMSKSSNLEQIIAQLAALRSNPTAPDAKELLTRGLESKIGYVVERAATVAGELKIDVTPALVRAFDRLMVSADQACGGKTAIAKTLYELGAETPEVFLAGVKHVQNEPGFGGSVDVAAGLRGVSALGLVRIAHREAMLHVADLLADPQPQARVVAARACAYSERDEAALLLRLKIQIGDKEPDVIAECVTAIMKLAPQKSIPLVAERLDDRDEMVRESAALALGESRRREAFDALKHNVERRVNPERRRPMLLGIAVCRLPDSIPYLLSLLADADVGTAMYVLEALKIYQSDQKIRAEVEQVLAKRNDPTLQRAAQAIYR